MKASKSGVRIMVDRRGICSSNEDLSDFVAPAVPEILALAQARVSFSELRNMYFASETRGSALLLRLSPRLETQSFWEELRSMGSCALTPDERLVYSILLSSLVSLDPLVTDFPVEGSAVRRINGRQYYDSILEPAEAASTLRGMGSTQERSTYLPRNSLLSFSPASLPKEELRRAFGELGDWCFLSLR